MIEYKRTYQDEDNQISTLMVVTQIKLEHIGIYTMNRAFEG